MRKMNLADMFEDAKVQLEEHKNWLRLQLEDESLHSMVDHIEIVSVKQEEMRDLQGRMTVSVTYSYPDALYKKLFSDPDLKIALADGVVLPDA